MQKKIIKKQMKALRKANHNSMELLEYLKKQYTFKTDEEEQLNKVIDHLVNINFFSQQIENNLN